MESEKRIKDLLPEGSYEAFLDHCEELSDFEDNDMLLGDYITWSIGWTDCLLALKEWLNTDIPEPPDTTQKGTSEGEPPFYGKTNGYLVNSFCCGKCRQAVAIAPHQAKYCMHCGTKIDWGNLNTYQRLRFNGFGPVEIEKTEIKPTPLYWLD